MNLLEYKVHVLGKEAFSGPGHQDLHFFYGKTETSAA